MHSGIRRSLALIVSSTRTWYVMIWRMNETSWHVAQTERLCAILQERSIAVSREVVSEFVNNMVTLVSESAGITPDLARTVITSDAVERWADSLAPTILASAVPGESAPTVLLSAHTLAQAAATLVELMRAARIVEQLADTAVLAMSDVATDSAMMRDLSLEVQRRVQSLSQDVARHLVTQPPLEVLQLPVDTYNRLIDFLDEVSQCPLLTLAEENGHGTYHHTVLGEYTLSDVVSATLHDLDSATA